MNSSLSLGNNLVKRHRMKKEDKTHKALNEKFEDLESQKNEKNCEEKDEHQIENTVKSLNTELEHSDQTNVKFLKDFKQKQGTSIKDEDDSKSPCGSKFRTKSNSNSAKDSALKTKSEMSNGIVNLKSDVDNEQKLHECCRRKRKRCEMECATYNQKFQENGLTCIGILPGLGGNIESSDDSDQSCSSGSETNENVKYDLLGRSLVYENKCSTGSG